MTIGNRLFHREVAATVGPASGGVGKKFKTRINFEVIQTSESTANKGKVSIYNLSQESRNFLDEKEQVVILEAGYRDAVEVLFIGDIPENGVKTERKGPDVITTIQAADGAFALTSSNFERSFSAGVTNIQILAEAVKSLGVTVALGVQKGIVPQVYLKGFSYSGMVKDLIDQLVKKMGLEWSIQNGTLQILPKSQDTGEEGVFLSQDTGLIGIPSKTLKGLTGKSLLNPKIAPGRLVVISSEQFTGAEDTFRVDRVKHEGDSHEGPFESQFECGIPGSAVP